MEAVRDALIVASNEYQDPGLRRLRAPAQDAEALKRVLGDPQIGGFHVRTLLDEPGYVISEAVEEFFADRRRNDLLLLHFSCHGVKDKSGELYFATTNTKIRLLGATAVAAEFVNRCMHRSLSRRILLLLDCCYAGAFDRGMVARADRGMGIEERFGGRGRAVITASSAMEYAFEGEELTETDELKPSVFTSALVEGLETGDADRDEDGYVGLDELYEYVYDKVRESASNQTPGKWTFGLEGELYIAKRRPVSRPAPPPTELQEATVHPLPSGRAAALSSNAEPLVPSGPPLLATATTPIGGVDGAARQVAARKRHDRLLSIGGGSAIVGAVLLVVALFMPWQATVHGSLGIERFAEYIAMSLLLGFVWLYSVILAALSAIGGTRTLTRRTKALIGPGVLLGIGAASPVGLLHAPLLLDDFSGIGPPLWLAAQVILVTASCFVVLSLTQATDVRVRPLLPHGRLEWFVILLGLASAIQILGPAVAGLLGFEGPYTFDWGRLFAAFWATSAALLIPACAAVATPRRFGVALLRGWIAAGVAIYISLWLELWQEPDIGLIPLGIFGFTLLVLLIVAVPFGRAAPTFD